MNEPRRISVITGSRADFGLLDPVIAAMHERGDLNVEVVVAGTHLLEPARTVDDVRARFPVAAEVPMQVAGQDGRPADARALARGISGFAELFIASPPDIVLVLGDRIEAFAAASAAAIGGIRVAHIHGGDRAEGVADESMRHAISKLAHVHLAASPRSAERLLCLGEHPVRIHLTGSPAIDGLATIPPLDDAAFDELQRPDVVVLMHPTGEADMVEEARAGAVLDTAARFGRVLAMHPNHDPGRAGVAAAIAARPHLPTVHHLPRPTFIGLLRRVRLLAGNSSAGRIEAAAIPVRTVCIGPRQAGRERPRHLIACPGFDEAALYSAFERGFHEPIVPFRHPYGDGHAGRAIAEVVRRFAPDKHPLTKRNTF
ncbi:MAG: UDP-N-acetylglucosamine 2-epimerase [Phycisphaerales bacterium]